MPQFLNPITGKPRYLPDAITGVGDYEPARALYVPAGATLRRFRAALAKAMAGTANCEVVMAGPSTTQGYPQLIATQSPTPYLITLLKNLGIPAATGWVWIANNLSGTNLGDSRWTTTGGTIPYNSASLKFPIGRTEALGTKLKYTSTETGTVMEWINSPSGAYHYVLDGGTSTAVASTIGNAAGLYYTGLPGLSPGTHNIEFTSDTGSPNQTYMSMARVRPAAGAVLITNAGWGGSRSDEWDTTTQPNASYGLQGASVANTSGVIPDLVILDCTMWINDMQAGSRTATQVTTQLTRVVNQYKTRGCDVLMTLISAPSSTVGLSPYAAVPDATYQSYRQAVYAVADATTTMMIDVPDRDGNWATANTNGLQYDAAHKTPAGYLSAARALVSVFLA